MTQEQIPLPVGLAMVRPAPHPGCAETVQALQQLLKEALEGQVVGLALVALHSRGTFNLQLRGAAIEECNQMGVVGMLASLQKMALEMH